MVIMKWPRRLIPVALMLILPILPSSVLAEIDEDSYSVELYAGYYTPGPDILDDDVSFGLRANFNPLKNFGITTQLGYFTTDSKAQMGLNAGEIDYRTYLLDVSFNGYLAADSPAVVVLYGGFGGSFSDTEFQSIIPPDTLRKFSQDSFTGNAGVGLLIDISESFFLRPDAKLRYIGNRVEDEWDAEYTLSIGWKMDY